MAKSQPTEQPADPGADLGAATEELGAAGIDPAGMVAVYTGTADVKEIDAAAWKNVGVEGQTKLVWNASNGKRIPADKLTPEAVAYLIEQDDFDFQPAS